MTVDEARRELWEWVADSTNGEKVRQLADAYALAAHVEACEEEAHDRAAIRANGSLAAKCGDRWYCAKAKELGR